MTDYSALAAQYGGTSDNPNDYSALAARFGGTPDKADPQIGNPQELTFAEKYVAPLLEKAGLAGNLRGSVVGGMMQGAADPGVKIVQLAANAVGQGDGVNKSIQNEEQQYQQARQEAGRGGWDIGRAVGNAAITAPVGVIGGAPTGLLGLAGKGALQGAVTGALQPVTDGGNVFAETAKDAAIGGLTGGVMGLGFGALSRVVSSKASVNPDLELLRNEGVTPTVGGVLGGPFKAMEEKAASFDPTGSVRAAQGRAMDSVNKAALNRTVAPVGGAVDDIGTAGYGQAKQALQQVYQDAASKVSHVNFDTPEFNADLGQLTGMAQGLTDPMQSKFQSVLNNVLFRKMSPNGSIAGADLKAVDSELGSIAANYAKSGTASEREAGDAFRQLQSVVRQQIARSDPEYAAATAAADAGWKNLVRVRAATKAAVNNGGVFTPGQLNMAARSMAPGDSAAMGTAPMQDLASAAQNIIGNKVPNSGTADRWAAINLLFHPTAYVPAAAAASGLYSRPVQNALVAVLANRPESAPAVANYLRLLTGPASRLAVPVATGQ